MHLLIQILDFGENLSVHLKEKLFSNFVNLIKKKINFCTLIDFFLFFYFNIIYAIACFLYLELSFEFFYFNDFMLKTNIKNRQKN